MTLFIFSNAFHRRVCIWLITAVFSSSLAIAQVKSQPPERKSPHGKTFALQFSGAGRPDRNNALKVVREQLNVQSGTEFIPYKIHTDKWGVTHERYGVYYMGIPVEHASMLMHFKGNKLISANGGNTNILDVDTHPAVSSSDAIQKALDLISAKKYMWEYSQSKINFPTPQLVIFQNQLAYKVDVYAAEPHSHDWVYVNAANGTIIEKVSQFMHNNAPAKADTRLSGTQKIMTKQVAPNQYQLRDYTRGDGIFTLNNQTDTNPMNVVEFIDNDTTWSAAEYHNANRDDAALDVHWGLQMAYDYWSTVHQRNSADGNGIAIYGYVHYGLNDLNAYSGGNSLYFGDGWVNTNPVTELGIIGHEFGHSVIGYASQLNYSNYDETSLIHEGLADVWGACLDNYANTNPLITLPAPKDVWRCANEVSASNPLQRNMATPNGPTTYLGKKWNMANTSYHTNGLLIGHWFYILTQGKAGVNDFGFAYNVQGIGIGDGEKIVYGAVNNYLPSNATISDLRFSTLMAATDIFGASSQQYQSVVDAWNAVGVPDLMQYCTPAQYSVHGQLSISQVQLAQKIFVDGEQGNQYGYHYDNTLVDFLQGTSYPIKLNSIVWSGSLTRYAKIWADLDRDGTFDGSNELLFQASNAGDPISGNITVPAGVLHGVTRLRIIMSNVPINSSCDDVYPNGETKDFKIRIYPQNAVTAGGYCIPFGSNASQEIIGFCKLGTLDGWGGWYPFGGYVKASTNEFKMWPGETYQLKLGPKFPYNQTAEEYFTIWIDYNLDKNFDASEIIFQGHTSTSLTGSVTIPLSAQTGASRLRIGMGRGAYVKDACTPIEFGEFMDYIINLMPSEPTSGGYCAPRGHCFFGDITYPLDFRMDSVSVAGTSINLKEEELNPNVILGYTDLTLSNNDNHGPIQVAAGGSYKLKLRPVSLDSPAYWTVWVDYNQNKVFEQWEVALASPEVIGTLSATLSIPAYAYAGNTRMRVALSYFTPLNNACGIINYGEMTDFLVNVQAPSCATPFNPKMMNVSAFSAVLAWTKSNGTVSQYEVQYRKQNVGLWVTATTPIEGITLQGLTAGTTYEFKVRAICIGNEMSAFTVPVSFTTPCITPNNLKVTDILLNQATVSWTTVSGAVSYELQYKKSTADTWTVMPNATSPVILSGLTTGTSYQVLVKTKCSNVDSNFTPVVTFNTVCSSKGTSTTFEYITFVGMANVMNQTGNNGGYLNYTASTIQLTKGGTYSLAVKGFIGAGHTDYILAWIDFNSNGTLEFSERIAYLTVNVSQQVYTTTFTVPSTAVAGLHQMRVSMKNPTAPTACETFWAGEVEDYRVNITTPPGARTSDEREEEEITVEKEFYIYPNPIRNVLNLNSSAEDRIMITDALGRVVYSGEGQEQLNVESWQKGMYFVRIRKKEKSYFVKVVKE